MLRAIQHDFLKPRLLRFRIDCTSGTPTASIGGEELASITDNGVGDFTLNLKFPFRRTPIVGATVTDGAAAAGYPTITSVTASAIRIVIRNSAGTAEDTRCNVFVLGYDSPDTNIIRPESSVVAPCRNPRIVCGSVTSAGVADQNGGTFTVTKSSTGVYVVTPRIAFGSTPVVVASPNQSTVAQVRVSSIGVASFTVETFNTSAVATDTAFAFVAMAPDASATNTTRSARVVREGSIGPRIVGVVAASGNASLSTNSAIGAIASGGTGIGNLTLNQVVAAVPSRRFLRQPVCIATCEGTTNTAQVNTTASSGTQVRTFGATGVGSASASHILLFGWDDAQTWRNR